MKNKIEIKSHLLFIILSLFLSSLSCKDDPLIPKPYPRLTLTVEEVSCTEAWLNLKLENVTLPVNLELKSDTSILKTYTSINSSDTVLYVDSLLPNQTYNLQVSSNQHQVSSSELSITTMDTTSHNFTWQTFEFGQNSSSTLYDVAIIDENNIWVVGEIYLNDSLGNPDPNAFNAVHWNGNQWELKRIRYFGNCSAVEYPPLKAIWAFTKNDIVITNGGSIGWFNGTTLNLDCDINSLLTGSISRIWGLGFQNIFVGGNRGNMVHFNGSQWRRIESGTSTNIQDVWGCLNSKNEMIVYCAVSNVFTPGDYKILTIDKNNIVDSVSWNTGRRVGTVWTPNGKVLYTGGGGVFNNKSGFWKEETSLPLYYTNRIRGNGLNDIFVGGDFGLVSHFNGMNWNIYQEFMQGTTPSFYSIAIKENLVVLSGLKGSKAIVAIGKRN